VLDRVRDIALAEEARPDSFPHRQLRVEHLDGEALLVPVRRRVDHRHPADAEHPVEPVLAAKDATESRASESEDLVVRHGPVAERIGFARAWRGDEDAVELFRVVASIGAKLGT
jgi:hypothetical protein